MKTKQLETKVLLFLLYLLPFIDILNGYMIRKLNISGIGSFFHLILLIVFIFCAYLNNKITVGKYEKCTFILIVVFFISGLINSIIINNYQSISLERVEKIITTAITFSCLIYLQKKEIISHEDFNKLLKYICIVIIFVSLFANMTGLGNYTYESSSLGMTGFFTGSNEPIAIYMILNVFLVYKLYRTNKFIYLIPFAANEINLLYAQSKSAYFSTVLFAICTICILFKILFKKIKYKKNISLYVIPIIFGALGVGLFSKNLISNTVSKFISRQNYMMNTYSDNSFLNYIFSGRIGRISELIYPIFNRNPLISIFQIMFGQGLNFDYHQILEIDILDTFLYGGFIAMFVIVLFMIFVLKDIWKSTKSKMIIILVLLLYFFSCTAGHIWTGGISGTYFALICSFLMFEKNTYESKENDK